jgi:hypothetical protein
MTTLAAYVGRVLEAEKAKPDARITNLAGSTPLLYLDSDAAREWGDENIAPDTLTRGEAFVLTPRQVNDVRHNMEGGGLIVA